MRQGLAKRFHWSDQYILFKFFNLQNNLFQRLCDSPLDFGTIIETMAFQEFLQLWKYEKVCRAHIGAVLWLRQGCNLYPG